MSDIHTHGFCTLLFTLSCISYVRQPDKTCGGFVSVFSGGSGATKTFTDPRRKKRKWPFSHRSPRSSDHSRAHFQAVRENSPLSVAVTQEEARQKLRSVSTNSKKTLYLTIYVNARVLIAFLSVTYERIVMW